MKLIHYLAFFALAFLLGGAFAAGENIAEGFIQRANPITITAAKGAKVFCDGDSCIEPLPIRFVGWDAPEIDGKCQKERNMAFRAKRITEAYVRAGGKMYATGQIDKYGRNLVIAPGLKERLIAEGLAREYDGGKRKGWC